MARARDRTRSFYTLSETGSGKTAQSGNFDPRLIVKDNSWSIEKTTLSQFVKQLSEY